MFFECMPFKKTAAVTFSLLLGQILPPLPIPKDFHLLRDKTVGKKYELKVSPTNESKVRATKILI